MWAAGNPSILIEERTTSLATIKMRMRAPQNSTYRAPI